MGLFSNSVPTAKFLQVGDHCTGVITDISQAQRTEFKRDGTIGGPMFWSNGKPTADAATDPRTGQPNQPVMDWVITVDTGAPDEDGHTERRIFVKGKAELASIKAACVAAGVRDIEVGGKLRKTWVSGGRPGGADVDNPRVYEYKYLPPAGQGGVSTTNGPAVQEALQRVQRAHDSSPVVQRLVPERAPQRSFEEEPPF